MTATIFRDTEEGKLLQQLFEARLTGRLSLRLGEPAQGSAYHESTARSHRVQGFEILHAFVAVTVEAHVRGACCLLER